MTVPRFGAMWISKGNSFNGIGQMSDGPYVRSEDYDALAARLAEAERLFKLTLRCLTDDEDGDVCHGRIRQFLRTTDADSAADSADEVQK